MEVAATGNTYFIRAGDFRAALLEDRLTELPRQNFRRLLRLARTEPENRSALDAMGADIRRRTAEAETAMDAAAWDYKANWKYVARPRSRRPEIAEITKENRRLQTAVRNAKGHYANWVSIQTIFEKECS